jgi:hypothetical protein
MHIYCFNSFACLVMFFFKILLSICPDVYTIIYTYIYMCVYICIILPNIPYKVRTPGAAFRCGFIRIPVFFLKSGPVFGVPLQIGDFQELPVITL